MNIDLVTYLEAISTKLKDQLPNHELFNREQVFDTFKEELEQTFNEFEVMAIDAKDKTVIIEKNGLKYRVKVTYEYNQIKVSALPYQNNKKTQVDSTKPIIVATPLYNTLKYEEKLLVKKAKDEFVNSFVLYIARMLEITSEQRQQGVNFERIKKDLISSLFPKAIEDQVFKKPNKLTYRPNDEVFSINFRSGLQLDIIASKYTNKEIHTSCIYHMKSNKGVVSVEYQPYDGFEFEFESYTKKHWHLKAVGSGYSDSLSKPNVIIRSYEDDTIDTLVQISEEENLANSPASFKNCADIYGFKPDHELILTKGLLVLPDREFRSNKYISLRELLEDPESVLNILLTATFEQDQSFDTLVQLAANKTTLPEVLSEGLSETIGESTPVKDKKGLSRILKRSSGRKNLM